MKAVAVVLFLGAFATSATAADSNPMGKALDLIDALAAKIAAEGEAEAKAYAEFVEWCDDTSKNAGFEITTATSKKEKLEATIAKAEGDQEACSAKIEELAAAIKTGDDDLKSATGIREQESKDFAAAEGELVDTVDTLGRAIGALTKEAAKNPAAFEQQMSTSNWQATIKSVSAVIDAAAFLGADRQKITALVQAQSGSDDEEFGAPAAATYKSHSGNIIDVLEDMKEKAEDQLAELRKAETAAKQNYSMLKQSLEDQLAADNKDMGEEKSKNAAAAETQATSEGELAQTVKDLANAKEALALANANCMTTAADHETTVNARAEELKVIATAKKILTETSSGAVEQSYSMIQLRAKMHTSADLANTEVVTLVQNLAKKQHSVALSQLASRIAAVVRMGGGADVFGKIKGLISDLIAKLESEADADADEKAYCDEQMAKTEAKQSELEDDVKKLSTKLDQASSKSAELKEEVATLQAELATLAKEQAEMDKIRKDQNAAYTTAKAELELGLSGVRRALSVLQDYYGGASLLQNGQDLTALMQQPSVPTHGKAAGAGQSIINILQVCESDFAKDLAAHEAEESDSAEEYDRMTQENAVTKTTKDQDVKYKSQEFKGLDKSIAELTADRASEQTELDAVNEYYNKIKERCIAKPETYEERAARRKAEIEGLKEALTILENETAFVQHRKRGLRGSVMAA